MSVVLSRLSSYYVFLESNQTWNATGASKFRTLPELELIDNMTSAVVLDLASEFESILANTDWCVSGKNNYLIRLTRPSTS
ncbi:hypothetical protein [Arthrobacter sp. GMC3]|uniref:hypothetical protein n=1 Tax=Arthrobacter sp. GMC3 TaxID=2058894 RepID=UPI0011B021F9|nr:hypothetical protein [Arthrobacter sp. GMC3]